VAKLPLEAEVDLAEGVGVGVFGPQAFEVLAHHTEGAFHCVRLDASPAGRNVALTVAVGKDLKEEDRVPHFLQPWVDRKVGAEALPDKPGGLVGGGA
jgi:hypothetical protein